MAVHKTAQTVSAAAPDAMRAAASGPSTEWNPRRFSHVTPVASHTANVPNAASSRRLIQPGERTSIASNCLKTIRP